MLERSLRTFQIGLKSLALHKLRSGLTVLGVVFGVGSVIVMLAVGEGARLEAIRQIEQLGATNIILRSVKPADTAVEDQNSIASFGLTTQDLTRIRHSIPTVVMATPVREDRKEVRYHDRKVTARLVGVEPCYVELSNLRLLDGRFVSEIDNLRKGNVVVLSADVVDRLFPFEDPVGRSVRIGDDQYYDVVGVVERSSAASSRDVETQEFTFDVYIPYETDRVRFGEVISYTHTGTGQRERPQITEMTVAVDDMTNVKATAELIDQIISRSHKQEDVSITVPLDLLEKAERTQRIFTLVLGSIASISLLVGGIGIMNIMLATVTERTREIGIRRALGAKRHDITGQFLMETTVLSAGGGLIGIVLGVLLSESVSRFFLMNTTIRLSSLVLAFTISVLVGLVFGTYPARRAALMDPIEALRHE